MRANPFRHQLAATSPLRLADLLVTGPLGSRGDDAVEALGAHIAREASASGVITCGSGTEALFLALQAAEWLSGGKTRVVLPAFTCFDVASAAVRFGRPVSFYDIDPATLGPDPDSLRSALRDGPQAVVVASLYGMPLDWDVLSPVLSEGDNIVIEDAAQGQGGEWRGAPLGAYGRLGVRSFGRGKGWTGGAGGALIVKHHPDWETIGPRLVDTLGPPSSRTGILVRAAAHWALGRPSVYGLPRALPGLGLGETHYRDLDPPTALPAVAAELALRSRKLADEWAAARRAAGHRYATLLRDADAPVAFPEPPAPGVAGYLRFPVITERGLDSFPSRTEATRLGAAESYPEVLPLLPQIRSLAGPPDAGDVTRWTGALTLRDRLITLPTHPLTTRVERDRLVQLLEAGSTG